MQYLSPREREKAELMGKKIAKLGCDTLIRFAYLANPQEFDGSNISGFWGALKQYAFEDLNGFRPDAKTKTSINYFFENWRKKYRCRKNIKRYRSRSPNGERFTLNLEEIASLFHFPGPVVEAPGLSRRTTRKRGAPGSLPTK